MRAAHSRLGPIGNVHLSPEAEVYFAKKGCKVLLQPTAEAIGVFNRSHAKDRTPTHGCAVTREAAMAAFAKSWRRE
jgi:hypothetical protein